MSKKNLLGLRQASCKFAYYRLITLHRLKSLMILNINFTLKKHLKFSNKIFRYYFWRVVPECDVFHDHGNMPECKHRCVKQKDSN